MNLKDKTVVIDNKTYRYSKIVMLATHEDISSIFDIPIIKWHDDNIIQSPLKNFNNNGLWLGQHLYFLSTDKICEGDWFYCSDKTNYTHIFQCSGITENTHLQVKSNNEYGYGDWARCYSNKIIASTDLSLNLPKPSDSFLQVYIDTYNKNEKIEECLVEYEELNQGCSYEDSEFLGFDRAPMRKIQRPKTTKGEITIRKVKDSCSREEVSRKISDFAKNFAYENHLELKPSLDFTINWIEENL